MPNFNPTNEPIFEIHINGYPDEPIKIFVDGRVEGYKDATFTIVNQIPRYLQESVARIPQGEELARVLDTIKEIATLLKD